MKVTDFLSRDEISELTRRSDLAGAWLVIFNWMMIVAIFAVVITWTNPLTVLLAIPLLGGRQLGLAVLMHEAGHKSLFKTPSLNNWVGQWLCAYPVMGDVVAYGDSHRVHHRYAGTDQDPDLPNYRNYPVSKASFKRKIKRDLTGKTGMLLLHALVGSARGRNVMLREGEETNAERRGLMVNIGMFLVMLALGVGAYYILWLVAYFIAYPLIARIRQVAEHGNVPNLYDPDPRMNTRTTYANVIERLLFCPNHVNYHLEHHMLAAVPCYRLPALHKLLLARGFYDGHEDAIARSYLDMLKTAVPELGGGAAPAT